MDIFSIFSNMKVCCEFSLKSPHRGDSNEYTQYITFNLQKKINLNYPKSAAGGFFPRAFRTRSKQPVVKEPSVFEPQKFYYMSNRPYAHK